MGDHLQLRSSAKGGVLGKERGVVRQTDVTDFATPPLKRAWRHRRHAQPCGATRLRRGGPTNDLRDN
jgi:hypothetical protein